MATEKIKILGALLEPPAKQYCRFGQFGPTYAPTFFGFIISVLASVVYLVCITSLQCYARIVIELGKNHSSCPAVVHANVFKVRALNDQTT